MVMFVFICNINIAAGFMHPNVRMKKTHLFLNKMVLPFCFTILNKKKQLQRLPTENIFKIVVSFDASIHFNESMQKP